MAGASIGMGHVARSASLARALESIGAEVDWACGREAALFLRDRGVPSGRIQIVTDESGASHESQLDRERQVRDAEACLAGESVDWVLACIERRRSNQ
jgi:spore coat polysaccharide biosynthesis predicted glycosyltransferase SpsG